ncbi:unnamed protein product [Sphagnum balticum]
MRPFRAKEVPAHVKDNLYEKLLKDQERERKQESERERLAEQESRSVAVRKLRQEKFAPIVRKVLRDSGVDPSASRALIA